MAQKPIKKINIQKKPTKYKKTLKKPKNDSERITKNINKEIVEKYETEYKHAAQERKKSKK